MEKYQVQFVQTIVVFTVYIIINVFSYYIISKVGSKFLYSSPRVTVVKKIIHFIYFILLFNFILFIWGVKQSELMYFVTSLLTVLGIAFFAQWSIISNITSSFIIFFNHPVKIGEKISIADKEYDIEGEISDIGIFFLTIETKEGNRITIPSNVFMQKMIIKKKE